MEQEQVADLSQSQNIGGMQSESSQEKMIPQSQVNAIIEARLARERAKHVESNNPQSIGGMSQLHPDEIKRMIKEAAAKEISEAEARRHEEYMRQAYAAEGQRIADKFRANIEAGKGEYEDFDKVFDVNDFSNMGNVLGLASEVDNTADVMYELAKNPSKAFLINELASKSPRGAQIEMMKLSDSIKKNKEAQKAKVASEPLSQIKPSIAGADNGSNSVTDFRKMFPG